MQSSLRLLSDDTAVNGSEGTVADVVFLCAEDDDLELVSFVHRARKEGIGVEVLPGVDNDVDAVLDKLVGLERDACVLFCGEKFSPSEALRFRQRFQTRFPDDEFLVIEIDPSRVDSLVQTIVRRLALTRTNEPSDVHALPVPADIAQQEASSEPPADTPPVEDEPPQRSKLPIVLIGLALIGAIGFTGWTVSRGASTTAPEPPLTTKGAPRTDAAEEAPASPPAPNTLPPERAAQEVEPDSAAANEAPPAASADEGAENSQEEAESEPPEPTVRPRRNKRPRTGKPSAPAPKNGDAAPESPVPTPPKTTPEPAASKPRRKAKLIDDGLLHTTD